ncbi:MAG: (2Fe-2S) ferredoxin domain-containing protein [Cyanobacteria bacterium J06623_7]
MTKSSKIVTGFHLSGKLSKIAYKKKKIQYIKLETSETAYWIKIPKKLREKIASLSPGYQLEVEGIAKQQLKTGKTRHKAQKVMIVAPNLPDYSITAKTATRSLLPILDREIKSKAKVLICQKSNCWKKGGKKVCDEIESVLDGLGLTREIPIKKTGCLKQCKKAPALVMLPDKARYSKVKPKQVAKIVEKHLIN